MAPLQTLMIPSQELLSAVLVARLILAVKSALASAWPGLEVECFTDSTVVWYWIKGTAKEWKPFVKNRVNEIRQKTTPNLWSHCPGSSNSACGGSASMG